MSRYHSKVRPERRTRAGFTLVELLVVIIIITVLVSLSGGTYIRVIATMRLKNTQALIEKLKEGVVSQQHAYQDYMKPLAAGDPNYQSFLNQTHGDKARALQMWMNQQLPMEFPQLYANAWLSSKYQNMMISNGLSTAPASDAGQTPSFESSACLYMALNVQRMGQAFNPDVALEGGSLGDHAVDANGHTVKVILDSWGDPIQFQWSNSGPNNTLVPLITSIHL
jgi:prepilin-type N-terminal cleavage/methylation domain-containing protein